MLNSIQTSYSENILVVLTRLVLIMIMVEPYYNQENFTKVNFTAQNLIQTEFENCVFYNCDFSEMNLTRAVFIDCIFETCNLSMANLNQVKMDNGQFRSCKLLGINFSTCSDFLFSVTFTDCILDYCVFIKKKLKATTFKNCSLKEVNFSECGLSAVNFTGSDLNRAIFRQTNLEKADFREAQNFSIDPESNKLKKTKFSRTDLSGLLDKYDLQIS